MNVVFLGAPGSGKGTQAKRLAQAKNLIHVSTGDVFRDAITNKTELGNKIKSFVEGGKLVPDALVSDVVFEKLATFKNNAFLLDGYPRTIDQAQALDQFLSRSKLPLGAVIFFEVDAAALIKRLSARRQCPKCKEVYNLTARPPKVAGKCDLCGTVLVQRPDDQENVVKERLNVYDKETKPILDYYKAKPFFHRINAAQPIEDVFRDLTKAAA